MKNSMAIRRATYGRALRQKRGKNIKIKINEFNIFLSNWLGNSMTPYLERFDESPKQGADALPSAEKLDQPHDSKQTKEGDGDASAVLCVLWRNSPESEESRRTEYVVNTENLSVLCGMMRSELRPQHQIHMGWESSTASWRQKPSSAFVFWW